MRRSATFMLLQMHIGSRYDLPEQLRRWRAAGVPANAVARLLEADTGIKIHGETVRRWLRTLDGVAA